LGALKHLVKNDFLDLEDISNIVGVSCGAMVGFLLSINYQIDELIKVICEIDFTLVDEKKDLIVLFEKLGLNSGKRLTKIFAELLFEKYKVRDITFKELYEKTKKSLYIQATNVNKQQMETFSHFSSPNMSVLLAVRMSQSIPLVFEPVYYNEQMYVDGGLISNFPLLEHISGNFSDDTTLGFNVTQTMFYDSKEKKMEQICIFNYLLELFKCLRRNNHINFPKYTINFDRKPDNIDMTDIFVEPQVIKIMLELGDTFASEYLSSLGITRNDSSSSLHEHDDSDELQETSVFQKCWGTNPYIVDYKTELLKETKESDSQYIQILNFDTDTE
jgi:predicted acylesterase/phospholipase RssA